MVGEGKYGPYIQWNGLFISISKAKDPRSLTLEDAQDLILAKKHQAEPILVFGDMQILDGRYGPYIKTPTDNYKIPKGTDVATLTEEQCLAIISAAQGTEKKKEKPAFRRKK